MLADAANGASPAAFIRRLAERDCGIPRRALDDVDLLIALERGATAAAQGRWHELGM